MSSRNRLCDDPEFINYVMNKARYMFLAMIDCDSPYCIPINFAREDNFIYAHCAKDGNKLEYLSKNNHVAFSMAVDVEEAPKRNTVFYKSVCGRGIATLLGNASDKTHGLDLIAARYEAECSVSDADFNINLVNVLRIEITHIMGKKHLASALQAKTNSIDGPHY